MNLEALYERINVTATIWPATAKADLAMLEYARSESLFRPNQYPEGSHVMLENLLARYPEESE